MIVKTLLNRLNHYQGRKNWIFYWSSIESEPSSPHHSVWTVLRYMDINSSSQVSGNSSEWSRPRPEKACLERTRKFILSSRANENISDQQFEFCVHLLLFPTYRSINGMINDWMTGIRFEIKAQKLDTPPSFFSCDFLRFCIRHQNVVHDHEIMISSFNDVISK